MGHEPLNATLGSLQLNKFLSHAGKEHQLIGARTACAIIIGIWCVGESLLASRGTEWAQPGIVSITSQGWVTIAAGHDVHLED